MDYICGLNLKLYRAVAGNVKNLSIDYAVWVGELPEPAMSCHLNDLGVIRNALLRLKGTQCQYKQHDHDPCGHNRPQNFKRRVTVNLFWLFIIVSAAAIAEDCVHQQALHQYKYDNCHRQNEIEQVVNLASTQ